MATFVRTQEIEHEIGQAGSFALRLTSGEVELRAVEGETARVRVEYSIRAASESEADSALEAARFRVRAAGSELDVSEPDGASLGVGSIARLLRGVGGRASIDASVSAEVPAGATVAFQGVSADVTATGLAGAQQYRTVSGDMVLNRVGGDLRVRGVSGDVSLRADAPIRLEANTVSGDLSAFAPRFDGLRVVTVSGDVELEGGLGDGESHRVETVSGDLSLGAVGGLELEVRGLSTDVGISLPHRSEGSRDRRRYVIGESGPSFLFSSMSGDVTVGRARRVSAEPPAPPSPPAAPIPPTTPRRPAAAPLGDEEQLRVLRALERGEIDVDEASRRLGGNGA